MKNLLILGAGGFGHMIQETAKILGYEEVVFLDDAVIGTDIIGKCCDYKAFLEKYDTAVAGLGDNGMRLYLSLIHIYQIQSRIQNRIKIHKNHRKVIVEKYR